MDSVYDRALSEVETGGYFQKKFDFFNNMVLSALWSTVYLHMILTLVIVPYTCKPPKKALNVTDEAWKLKYIPHENIHGNIKFDTCSIYLNPNENNLTRSCDEYEYDKTWYGSTVASEKDWVCDKEIYIPNILAYSKITELIGSMFFGWIGDTYGRRLTHIVTMALTLIGRIISLLPGRSFLVFLSGSLLTSFATWSAMQTATIICVEITSSKRRSMLTCIRFASGSLAVAIMPFIYWWVKDWKTFVIVTTIPLIVFFLFSWNIIESPRWQFTNGKTKQCVKQLKRMAKINKTTLSQKTEEELLCYKPESTSKSLGPLALFSGRTLALYTTLQLVLWIVGNACFTTQVLSIGQKIDANPYLEFSWQTISEIPVNFLSAWLADRLGRRYTGALSFSITSVAWFLIAFRESSSYLWTHLWWIGTILNIIIRMSNSVSYYAANLFAMELYPTCLRQSGLALGNVFASLGSVMAPYILYLGRPIDERLPSIIISAMCIGAVISSLLLPETLNAKLPETIEEAQSFGRKKHKYSSVHLKRVSVA
ncbi:solute carrier family 22 member 1-like [Epargyreus clarus]|uniref:solute carrier family 22 member 1-like n=1 Tax=Epargyreus clarus TaxID=520877 RepID=UPI003C2CCF4D